MRPPTDGDGVGPLGGKLGRCWLCSGESEKPSGREVINPTECPTCRRLPEPERSLRIIAKLERDGAPRSIVTPSGGQKRLQRDGVEQEDCGGNFRSFEGQQVSGAFISARTIFTGGVVPELVGGGFGEEIGLGREDLSLEQFGFDGVVNAFDVGVGLGCGLHPMRTNQKGFLPSPTHFTRGEDDALS